MTDMSPTEEEPLNTEHKNKLIPIIQGVGTEYVRRYYFQYLQKIELQPNQSLSSEQIDEFMKNAGDAIAESGHILETTQVTRYEN